MVELNLNYDITVMVRPSGTEPKIKFYYFIVGESNNDCDKIYNYAVEATEEFLKNFN